MDWFDRVLLGLGLALVLTGGIACAGALLGF